MSVPCARTHAIEQPSTPEYLCVPLRANRRIVCMMVAAHRWWTVCADAAQCIVRVLSARTHAIQHPSSAEYPQYPQRHLASMMLATRVTG